METSTDYENEVSQIEYVCQELDAQVLLTTKFHAEYAGEDIGYSWAYSNDLYHKYPITSNKRK